MNLLDPEVVVAVREHALASYPRESCGVVMPDGYHPLENIAADPNTTFECTAQLLEFPEALALVHSHPDGPDYPSAHDMAQQVAMDLPWGLIPCDHEGSLALFYWSDAFTPPPLRGRGFRYGPSGTDGKGDCAALVRDWYRLERGLQLPEFPRENKWWLKDGVSYADNLVSAGFVRADQADPQVGDVFIASIRSTKPNHAGIYLGHGLVLHHLEGRLSREDPAVNWMRFVTGWFRHGG